jgi:hypothetical protein
MNCMFCVIRDNFENDTPYTMPNGYQVQMRLQRLIHVMKMQFREGKMLQKITHIESLHYFKRVQITH